MIDLLEVDGVEGAGEGALGAPHDVAANVADETLGDATVVDVGDHLEAEAGHEEEVEELD